MKRPGRRMTVLLVAGLVLIGGAIFYIRFFMTRPMGGGPAGPAVDAAPFAQPWTERPVRLVGLGDSITKGLGAVSESHTFFNRLRENPDDEYDDMRGRCLGRVLPNLEHENLAISGSTSQTHLDVIEKNLVPSGEDVFGLVVMTTGGNDLIHSYGRLPPRECAMYGATLEQAKPWIAAFERRLETMLDKIEAAFPGGCEIYVADIYDPTDGVGDAPSVFLPDWPDGLAIHQRYNEILRAAAASRANVHTVPLHATFLGHGSHCRQSWRDTYRPDDPNFWFWTNIEDPNDRGYDAIRRVFLNTIVEHTTLRQSTKADDMAEGEPVPMADTDSSR